MKCSFCGKLDKEVKLIVAANNKVGICDECIINSLKLLIYGEQTIKINLDTIKINLDKEEKEERHGSFLGIND
jgi:ATP-dependent protease Clp ATPase subunit